MNLIKTYIDKLWYFFIYALALFPILPRGIESVLMISFFLSSLILYLLADKKEITKTEVIKVIILSTIFILYVVGLLYSENLKEGIKLVIRTLPIVVFPLVFGFFRRDKLRSKHIKNVLNLYVLSLFFGLIFIHFYLFYSINIESVPSWEYRNAFEALTGVHGTYYSLWIAFGVLILFFKILKTIHAKNILLTFLIIFILSYFIYWQIVVGARLPLIITIIFLIASISLKIKKKRFILTGITLLIGIVFGITILKPNYLKKVIELITYDFSLPKGDYNIEHKNITSEQIRNGIYYCSVNLIKKSWIYGYGIGDVDDKLQNCYKQEINSNVYQIFNYNTHNQYLHFLLSSGLVGLFLFLISLFLPVYISYQTSNYLYLLLSLLLIISLFTENILSRHDGILFYSFFNSIFAFLNNDKF